ncbi:MAG TPA: DinB family protein [Actinomycetota bacterium]|nr:DinB family protein [Actinomycetota bacterium]
MTDPTIEAARDILAGSLGELRAALEGCSAEQLNRRPAGDDSNSLTVVATHALYSTRSWLSLATGAELPPRDRPAEFQVVETDPRAFMRSFDELAGECTAILGAASEFDPAREGTAPWRSDDMAQAPVTAAWSLQHALTHLGEHVGHAQLSRQLV